MKERVALVVTAAAAAAAFVASVGIKRIRRLQRENDELRSADPLERVTLSGEKRKQLLLQASFSGHVPPDKPIRTDNRTAAHALTYTLLAGAGANENASRARLGVPALVDMRKQNNKAFTVPYAYFDRLLLAGRDPTQSDTLRHVSQFSLLKFVANFEGTMHEVLRVKAREVVRGICSNQNYVRLHTLPGLVHHFAMAMVSDKLLPDEQNRVQEWVNDTNSVVAGLDLSLERDQQVVNRRRLRDWLQNGASVDQGSDNGKLLKTAMDACSETVCSQFTILIESSFPSVEKVWRLLAMFQVVNVNANQPSPFMVACRDHVNGKIMNLRVKLPSRFNGETRRWEIVQRHVAMSSSLVSLLVQAFYGCRNVSGHGSVGPTVDRGVIREVLRLLEPAVLLDLPHFDAGSDLLPFVRDNVRAAADQGREFPASFEFVCLAKEVLEGAAAMLTYAIEEFQVF